VTRPAFPDPPFVLDPPSEGIVHERLPGCDTYRGPAGGQLPAVVFVPGPVPAALPVQPRDWQFYRGYGRLAAGRDLVAVVPVLSFHGEPDVPAATEQLADIIDEVRAMPGVDPDRIAIWAFSGGGWLIGRWLAESPTWLRCLALSYPAMGDDPVQPGRPIVLTRVGQERPELQAAMDDFLARAKDSNTDVQVIEVPDGRHGFDVLDHTDQSRDAVNEAMTTVAGHLTSD